MSAGTSGRGKCVNACLYCRIERAWARCGPTLWDWEGWQDALSLWIDQAPILESVITSSSKFGYLKVI